MSSNPALNDKVFQREAQASRQGDFTPGWGSPADEVPTGLFGGPSSTPAPGSPPPTSPPPGYGYQPGYPPSAQGGGLPPTRPPAPTPSYETMRMSGTMTATAILLLILAVAGWFGWQAVTVTLTGIDAAGRKSYSIDMPPWLILSFIGGFGLAILTIVKPKLARFTAPAYAAAEGLLLGAISASFNAQFDGIVLQAVCLTIGVFVMMLVLYATGTIKVTNRLRTGIIAATGAICVVYLISFVITIVGGTVPFINDATPLGIGISLLVVGVAAMNLLLDFDFIERAVAMQAPRYMEWFGAFGLMVTLVWLYLEILRLLAKLRSR